MTVIRDAATRYITSIRRTPEQTVAFAMALWLFGNGPAALIISPDFALHPMHSRTVELLGFVPVTVNGWHAVFHLITGGLGLILVRTRAGAISYAAIIATIYVPVGLFGIASGVSVCGVMAVHAFDSWVHVIEGATMLLLALIAALAPRTNA